MFRNILALLILFPLISNAQYKSDFKEGIYYSIEELNNNTPHYDTLMEISTYRKKDTLDILGVRYLIKIGGEEVENLNIFCIVKDSVIYLHNRRFDNLTNGFKKVLVKSKNFYRFIYSTYDPDNGMPIVAVFGGGLLMGLVSVAVTGAMSYSLNGIDGKYYRQHGLVDIHTGKFTPLTEKGMVTLLFHDHHDLYLKYREMKDRYDIQKLYELIDEYEQSLN